MAVGVRSMSGIAPGESMTIVVGYGTVSCGSGVMICMLIVGVAGCTTATGDCVTLITVGEAWGGAGLTWTAWQAARIRASAKKNGAVFTWLIILLDFRSHL